MRGISRHPNKLSPSLVNIKKYREKIYKKGLSIKEQNLLLDELSHRPYRFSISLSNDIDLDNYKILKTEQKIELELDDETKLSFFIKDLTQEVK